MTEIIFYSISAIWVFFEMFYLFHAVCGHPKYEDSLIQRMLLGPFGLLLLGPTINVTRGIGPELYERLKKSGL